MKLADLSPLLKEHALAQHVDALGIANDSRHVRAGDVFFALSGSKADGAKFLSDAAARGASAAVVADGALTGRA